MGGEMKKILIADNYKPLVDLYKTWVGDEHECIEACDGQEAVDLYKAHKPDLVIMEAKLPVLDGDKVITEIFEVDPKANIVVATAYPYTDKELGVPVIRKGFNKKAFLDMVKESFERK